MTIREDKYGNAVQASRPGVSQSLAVGATSGSLKLLVSNVMAL